MLRFSVELRRTIDSGDNPVWLRDYRRPHSPQTYSHDPLYIYKYIGAV